MGQLYKAGKKAKGGEQHHKKPTGNVTASVVATLAELGISKKESSEAQTLAAMPKAKVQEIAEGKTTVAKVRREKRHAEAKAAAAAQVRR